MFPWPRSLLSKFAINRCKFFRYGHSWIWIIKAWFSTRILIIMFFEAFPSINFWFCCWRSWITFVFSADNAYILFPNIIFQETKIIFRKHFYASVLAFKFLMCFLMISIQSSIRKILMCVYLLGWVVLDGVGMGVSSGKLISEGRDASFRKVLLESFWRSQKSHYFEDLERIICYL